MKETSKSNLRRKTAASAASSLKEVRCAVRFPLSLPVLFQTLTTKYDRALTRNVSANGVLLELHGPLEVGQEIDFSSAHARKVLGTPRDVLGSLSWTCGTLLHKPKSISGCCHDR